MPKQKNIMVREKLWRTPVWLSPMNTLKER